MGYWVLIGGMGYESFDCIASGHQNITTYETCTRAPHGGGAFMPAAVGLHRRVQIFQNLWPIVVKQLSSQRSAVISIVSQELPAHSKR